MSKLDLWGRSTTCGARCPKAPSSSTPADFSTWAHRFWRYSGLSTQPPPTVGSMGYGVPAAVAAEIAAPEHTRGKRTPTARST